VSRRPVKTFFTYIKPPPASGRPLRGRPRRSQSARRGYLCHFGPTTSSALSWDLSSASQPLARVTGFKPMALKGTALRAEPPRKITANEVGPVEQPSLCVRPAPTKPALVECLPCCRARTSRRPSSNQALHEDHETDQETLGMLGLAMPEEQGPYDHLSSGTTSERTHATVKLLTSSCCGLPIRKSRTEQARSAWDAFDCARHL